MTCLFTILGQTRIRADAGLRRDWAAPKTRAMLGALLTRPGEWFTTTSLVDWMWTAEDRLPKNIAQTFYNYANRIRDGLRPVRGAAWLEQRRGAYRIVVPHAQIDYFAASALLDRARAQPDPAAAVVLLREAIDHWLDEPLADLPGEPAQAWRRNARDNLWLPLQNALCESLAALGDYRAVLAHTDGLPPEDSAHLPLVMRRLEALHGLHLRTEMTAYYFAMRRRLQDEFEDAAAAALKEFFEGLSEPAPVEPRRWSGGAVAPRRLPHDVEDFVGREALLAKLDAVTGCGNREPRPGVVLLDGAAGVGKTALAVHWAHRVADQFPGGVLHRDLKGFSADAALEPATVVDGFLEALGADVDHLTTAERRSRRLESLLADRRALVVLDNVRERKQVEPLLAVLRSCTVVITSRNRLQGLGHRTFAVSSMDTADAVRMLDARIGDRGAHQRRAVEDLVTLCRGLPLAIDIVAHRIAASPGAPLAEFVEQLRDERRLLDLGGHGGDDSLKTVFSWSYRALRHDDRRTFRLLGLHPGPDIGVDAAAAILGVRRSAALDCLELLVATHLVEQPGSLRRYRFHDLLREYAEECARAEVPADEQTAAEQRLVDFFLHTAKEADSITFPYRPGIPVPSPVDGVLPLEFESDREARAWAVGERGNLMAVLDLAARRGMHTRVTRLAHLLGDMFRRCGYYDEARSALTMAIGAAQLDGDLDAEGASYNDLGLMALKESSYLEARRYFHYGHLIAQRTGSRLAMASSVHNLAQADVAEGLVERGIQRYEEVLALVRDGGADLVEIEAATWHRLGVVAMTQNRRLDSAVCFQRALELRIDNVSGRADTLCELGELHRRRGDLPTADRYARASVALHRDAGDRATAARAYVVLASIKRDMHDVVAATNCARQAVQLTDRAGNSLGRAEALLLLADLRESAKAHAAAEEGWAQALKIFTDAGDARAPEVEARLSRVTGDRAIPTARTGASPVERGQETQTS
ncbi:MULTISPECIES: AfsR/SARP family transcriptional regulator [unclassified Saccharothrix]|uniref:AfsR/SARP family transcriptional regulator n=1 Tax=unclassified Saccharothrix TaxID=2593673 RepID=UPI00307DE238